MLPPHRHSWHTVNGTVLSLCVLQRQYWERKVVVCPYHIPTLRTSSIPWFCGYRRHALSHSGSSASARVSADDAPLEPTSLLIVFSAGLVFGKNQRMEFHVVWLMRSYQILLAFQTTEMAKVLKNTVLSVSGCCVEQMLLVLVVGMDVPRDESTSSVSYVSRVDGAGGLCPHPRNCEGKLFCFRVSWLFVSRAWKLPTSVRTPTSWKVRSPACKSA